MTTCSIFLLYSRSTLLDSDVRVYFIIRWDPSAFMESAILHNIRCLSFSVVHKCRRIPFYDLKYTLTLLSSKVDWEYTKEQDVDLTCFFNSFATNIYFFGVNSVCQSPIASPMIWYLGDDSLPIGRPCIMHRFRLLAELLVELRLKIGILVRPHLAQRPFILFKCSGSSVFGKGIRVVLSDGEWAKSGHLWTLYQLCNLFWAHFHYLSLCTNKSGCETHVHKLFTRRNRNLRTIGA